MRRLRIWWRRHGERRWHALLGATACRTLGHRLTIRKWRGLLCSRCLTFRYYEEVD